MDTGDERAAERVSERLKTSRREYFRALLAVRLSYPSRHRHGPVHRVQRLLRGPGSS